MSYQANISRDERLFLGEDKQLVFVIYTDATLTTCQDVTGFALSWSLAARQGLSVVLNKTTAGGGITISGTFNPAPAINTQRVTVTIAKADTQSLAFGTWHHEVVRLDTGLAGKIADGTIYFHKPVHAA